MATKYFMNGGVDSNWASATNWSTTSSAGPNNTTKAIAGDAAILDAGSPNCIISAAEATASINCTGYTGTLTYNNTLTTTSTVTYPAGMTIAGTSDHVTVTTSTLTITPTLTGGLRLGGTSQTYTLGAALTMNGTLLLNGTTGTTFSGNYLITAGALSVTASNMALVMSGDITITGDAQFSSATTTTISGGKNFQAATCTVSGAQTMTITNIGSMTITGLTTSSTVNVFTGGIWSTGGLTTTAEATGTTVFRITGGTITLTDDLSCSLNIDGNVTWASATNLWAKSGTPTLTHTSGTVTVGTSVLSIASACTFVPKSGETLLYSLLLTAGAFTVTINTNPLIGTGTLTCPNAAITFGGSAGWTFGTVANTLIATSARTYTLTAGNAYTITTLNDWDGTSDALDLTIASSHGTNKVTLILALGASQHSAYMNGTRIDSSGGQTFFTAHGTITDCYNWTDTIDSQNILNAGGGETLAVAGVTKNSAGDVLGSCDCYLFRDNGNNTATYMGYVQSNASTGAYSFSVFSGSSYFVVCFKNGSPNVFDVTDRTLVAD